MTDFNQHSGSGDRREPKIGFLVKTFPKLSETFILGEILGLERQGLSLDIFSLRRPSDRQVQPAARDLRATVSYVPPVSALQFPAVVAAHLRLLGKSPARYLGALRFLLSRAEGVGVREFLQAGCLAGQLRRNRIEHLHVHFASEPAGVAELVEKLTGIPYSISAHAKDIYLPCAASLRRKLRGARFTVTCTEYNRDFLTRVAGADARVYRMYHGLDLGLFRVGGEAPAARDAVPTILSVGRLREKKGFEVLIEACGRLRDAGVTLRCRIVGYGPDRKRLAALIARYRLEDTVELCGKMTHEALIGLYREATVFVLPCLIARDGDRDGIPNVLLEAMALRLPVVSTEISGIPEVVRHGENGLLTQPRDAPALAAAIQSLFDRPEERARMGAAGRETIERMFSIDDNLATVRALLADASRHAARGPVAEAGIKPVDGGRAYAS